MTNIANILNIANFGKIISTILTHNLSQALLINTYLVSKRASQFRHLQSPYLCHFYSTVIQPPLHLV